MNNVEYRVYTKVTKRLDTTLENDFHYLDVSVDVTWNNEEDSLLGGPIYSRCGI